MFQSVIIISDTWFQNDANYVAYTLLSQIVDVSISRGSQSVRPGTPNEVAIKHTKQP